MKPKNRKGYGLLLFLLLLVLFIWLQSLQQGSISHRESQWVLKMVQRLFSGHRLGLWLNDGRIRRLAHLTEYSSLGFFTSLYSWRRWRKNISMGILTLGIAIASMDEIFQYFAGGRTATWKDVCLDGAEVVAGIVMWRMGKWVFGRRPSAGG
ncbi:VanZ family protein [Acidaminococcus fermentans]|uniref:VanZ family protein n=1 Tax=Acidaminococcus fermentans TaxID=905 RepID=UPI002E772E00|nr:VanZ family protein [Acidaminococcus fermentans]MEE1597326.1 VanZ family protein [Acidaminococcus fermentans]MEE4121591.1 VanZ family protein [Acidaminococcus fermentans]